MDFQKEAEFRRMWLSRYTSWRQDVVYVLTFGVRCGHSVTFLLVLADTIRKLCEALGVQVKYIVDGTEISGQ